MQVIGPFLAGIDVENFELGVAPFLHLRIYFKLI